MCNETEKTETFDHIPSAEKLAEIYAQAEKANPASLYYERMLTKPKLPVARILLSIFLTVAACIAIGVLVRYFTHSLLYAIIGGISALLLVCLLFAKHIILSAIKIYQATAPAKLRNRCRYEPSCSNYMILSIEKYGTYKGVKKGLKRWRSCKPPNGGYDWP